MEKNTLPDTQFHQNWTIRKPVARGDNGLVASQHKAAAEVGAEVLRAGGNAVDAAVATSFAVSVVEPWMSGLGGGAYMQIGLADKGDFRCINMGMVAPGGLRIEDYPLAEDGGVAGDLFAWPRVVDDRNITGYLSVAVPGYVAGMALAWERYGTMPWAELLAPAVALAEQGLPATWYMALRTLGAVHDLAKFPASREIYLPDGLPPMPVQGEPIAYRPLGRMADTLRRLAEAGAGDFYTGDIAAEIERDASDGGSPLGRDDLAAYEAGDNPTIARDHGHGTVHAAPGLTAGPTLLRVLELVDGRTGASNPPAGDPPDAATFAVWAQALADAYEERFRSMGDVDDRRDPASTTNLTVADRHGNMVCLTQTLLSAFGSKVVFPGTGILMNNGVMWFDPRPGKPNSLAPGKRPLSNMCPVIVARDGKPWFAVGGSGGRRIMPAVFQVLSMLAVHGMALEDACHHPRIDVSGEGQCTADPELGEAVARAVAALMPVTIGENALFPHLYACPNVVPRDPDSGGFEGMAHVMTPPSGVVAG